MSGEQHGSVDDRARRQGINLARHLNERYPDTVLFLARRAAGQFQATSASLVTVEPGGLTLATDADPAPAHVPLPVAGDGSMEVRARVRALLAAVRAAHPDDPLTSLEQQGAPGHSGHGAR